MSQDIFFDGSGGRRRQTAPVRPESGSRDYTEKIDSSALNKRSDYGMNRQVSAPTMSSEQINSAISIEKQLDKEDRKKHRKIFRRRFLAISLALILVLSMTLCFLAINLVSKIDTVEYGENEYVSSSALISDKNITNILLIGVDSQSKDDVSRSDSMILVSIDKENRTVKTTSFMRDTFVTIPGRDYKAKLNASCAYGGAELVCNTIEYNFGIKIDGFALIGYEAFVKLIDGLGGITVPEIDKAEAAALYIEGFPVTPGKNITLCGWQALLYSRIRKGQTDFQRTERQREVIDLIIEKIKTEIKTLSFGELYSAAADLLPCVECSIPKTKLIPLLMRALFSAGRGIQQARVPADGTWWNETTSDGQMVLAIDIKKNTDYIKNFIYGK